MQLRIHARTHVGRVRQSNEDAFGVWTPSGASEDEVAFLAVADGMGGHPGGEIASQLAVEAVREVAASHPADDPAELLRAAYDAAQDRILARGKEEPRYREMGTTLTCVWFARGRAHVAHVGDTRLYWFRGPRWVRVTADHTMAQDLVDSGKLEPEDAEEHPTSHVLTRCLGICPRQSPDILHGTLGLKSGDTLLLATDGLAKTVHDETLAEMVAGNDPELAAEWMIEAALAAGGPDNVTVLLARAEGDVPVDGAAGRRSALPVHDLAVEPLRLTWDVEI